MAQTAASDWKIYNEELQAGYVERATQAFEGFYTGSRGAIVITDAMVKGDYMKESFFKPDADMISRRITTGTGYNSALTATANPMGEEVKVRLARKIFKETTLDALRKTGITPDTLSLALGRMIADATAVKMANDLLIAGKAALSVAGTLADRTGETVKTLNREALVAGMQKLGDHGQEVVCWVMHSKPYFDLIKESIDVSKSPDSVFANVALYGAAPATFNKPCIVMDAAPLITTATTNTYNVLGLTAGALKCINETTMTDIITEVVTGLENLMLRMQGERDWMVGVKGFAWDIGTGGANPLDAALGTQANWDLVASSVKLAAGCNIKVQ